MEDGAVLVTGGNSGIGFECARALARRGWHVVIASRDRAASAAAVERIRRDSGNGAVSERGLDLGSLTGVRAFVRELESDALPLRALVCNAGLQVTQGRQSSAEGFELTFAVNHLGHFLLTNLLLTRLLTHAPARIVMVASGVHDPKNTTGMPKPTIADMGTLAATGGARRGDYDGRLAYVNSKLCNVWFTYELVRRLAAAHLSVTVNAFDPGLVPGSGLARDYPAALRWLWNRVLPGLARVLSPVLAGINPADKSGGALARLVVDPALAGVTGKYFSSTTRWREAPSSEASYDVARARDLWEASLRMTGLTRDESPLAA
ncbi:MAG: SDR family NAD(P)-dependent oxidoreductase [Deltaproteobacteria bacterium]|nr:SDR family NAD(P)-dependent oxidoreductase [Deltaproteobacteria bacterium]